MHNLEKNKIFAAILVAGIVASFAGFAAKKLVAPTDIKAAGAEASGDAGGAAAAPEMPGPILDLIAKGNADHGKQVAAACGACHNFDKGGANGVGPNLWNALTRGHAGAPGFSYSDDMAKVKGQAWTYEDLNKFIWKPKSLFPGTKMTFPGLKKDSDRVDVIAFLRTLNDTPPPLPTAVEIAKEKKDLTPAAAATTAPGAPAAAAPDKGADAGKPATSNDSSADKATTAAPADAGTAPSTPPAAQTGAAATPAKTPDAKSDTAPAEAAPKPQQ